MSDIIRLLPDSVANQIAAGEVIQRPASVVKELVENAVDAGADNIEVVIRDAGRTLVQVIDNGRGMSPTDARMAFERHATSKIAKADDLYTLHTMGFRGEALASICAVAQVELRSKTADAEIGTRLVINGSKVETQEPFACNVGSNMMVKNLFFNIPARRKFMKKDAVEFNNIAREFERMALVNPDIDLSLTHNDTVIHQLLRGSFKRRISDLFGKSLEHQLLPVSTRTSIVEIEGFVGSPEHARKRGALQYLTVNGRHMRHPYFHKAIMHCYEPLIAADLQPCYFLNFTVDPSTIDVNIHPTKNEIKFENEAAVWQIIVAAVRESLGRFNAGPGIDFDVAESGIDIPVFQPNADGDHSVEIDTSYNPFAQVKTASNTFSRPSSCSSSGGYRPSAITQDWDKLYAGFMNGDEDVAGETPSLSLEDGDAADSLSDASTLQVKGRFILSASVSGLMIIDQHRAHVRVLYERFFKAIKEGEMGSQQVLFPEVITLSAAQHEVLKTIEAEVREAGFDLSFLGDRSWSVVAVPSLLDGANATETIVRIIDDASQEISTAKERMLERVALSMATGAAIRNGQRLSATERETLISDLLRLPSPAFTPDGNVVIRVVGEDEIEKIFAGDSEKDLRASSKKSKFVD